jgi:glycosyltransferase involved in cell wall biosynthesis
MHIRSRPKNTILARWQAASISRNMDELIFIYGVVKTHFCELGGANFGETIFNVPSVNDGSGLHPGVPEDDRLKVASLSNYHYLNKATDRLIDVAQALSQRGRADILFVIAGDMTLNRRLPGRLGEIGAGGGTLGDYAAERGVADYFLFLGHVKDPESVLNACGALVRVARTKDPWGRDVIEALSFGLPVVTISAGEGFVVDGRNGIVHDEFHPDRFAGALLQLADNQALRRSLGTAGKAEISQLCDGPSRAADMVRVWQTAWKSRAA